VQGTPQAVAGVLEGYQILWIVKEGNQGRFGRLGQVKNSICGIADLRLPIETLQSKIGDLQYAI
jgi:hypothetical protein